MVNEAGYKGSKIKMWNGDFYIVKSWLSEPDGNGGRLVDINIDLNNGYGQVIMNLSTENLEAMLITEGN